MAAASTIFVSAATGTAGFDGESIAADTDVAHEYGDPGTGVSAARDPAGVVSAVDDDGSPAASGELPSESATTETDGCA